MPLDLTHLLNIPEWCDARKEYPNKVKQAVWFDKFHTALYYIDGNTSVSYMKGKGYTYAEGTPIFHWFKLTKAGVFINHSYDTDEWKQYDSNSNIRKQLLKMTIDKWDNAPNKFTLEPGYILFPIQRMSAQLKLIMQCIEWAKENKTRIVFRPHPYPSDTVTHEYIWNKLKLNEYVCLSSEGTSDQVIRNCSALWTSNSGMGLQALLYNKPVAYFLKDYDHTYGPIATYCNSVLDAALAKPIGIENVDKYLNWYYNEIVIDLSADDYIEKIRDRICE